MLYLTAVNSSTGKSQNIDLNEILEKISLQSKAIKKLYNNNLLQFKVIYEELSYLNAQLPPTNINKSRELYYKYVSSIDDVVFDFNASIFINNNSNVGEMYQPIKISQTEEIYIIFDKDNFPQIQVIGMKSLESYQSLTIEDTVISYVTAYSFSVETPFGINTYILE